MAPKSHASVDHQHGRNWGSRVPIDYCALRGLDLYAILFEDRRALFLARAEEDDSIVRLIDALDDAALEWLLAYATTLRKAFRAKAP